MVQLPQCEYRQKKKKPLLSIVKASDTVLNHRWYAEMYESVFYPLEFRMLTDRKDGDGDMNIPNYKPKCVIINYKFGLFLMLSEDQAFSLAVKISSHTGLCGSSPNLAPDSSL